MFARHPHLLKFAERSRSHDVVALHCSSNDIVECYVPPMVCDRSALRFEEVADLRWGLELPTILEAYLTNEVALKRYLGRFIKSREAADDLAQEAFLRAFAAEGARVIESPKAFLFKVAKNLALNELARQSTAAVEPLGDFEGQEVLEDSSQAAVDDVVDSRERIRLLARAISALPPQCAKVFILRKMQGLSQKEIAARLNISVRTVENHIATGLSRCRAYMREHGGAAEKGAEASRMPERAPTAFVKAKKAE